MVLLIQSALIIFALRMVDITLYTMRMLMVMRGRKIQAWIFGFFQALVFVIAIRAILADLNNWLNIAGYAAGFATGNVLGMALGERLSSGYVHLDVISSRRGTAIAERVRAAGYAVTEIPSWGKDGMVTLLSCSVERKHRNRLSKCIEEVDPEAFITVENVRSVGHGHWGS